MNAAIAFLAEDPSVAIGFRNQLAPTPRRTEPKPDPAPATPLVVQLARNLCATPPDCLGADQLTALLTAAQFLPAYLESCEAEAKKRLAAGEQLDGWELVPGQKRTAIHNPVSAWRRLASLLHEEEFLNCCTIGVGKITEAIQKAEGVTEDEAKQILADYLRQEGNLVTTTGAPRLARKHKPAHVGSTADGPNLASTGDATFDRTEIAPAIADESAQ